MNLDTEEIILKIISYQNKNNLSLEKMAKLFGMKGKSSFSRVIESRNVGLKHFVQFLNNTGIDPRDFFGTFIKTNHEDHDDHFDRTPPAKKNCTNPECLEMISECEKTIKNLNRHIETLYEKIEHLQSEKGGQVENKTTGGVVEDGFSKVG